MANQLSNFVVSDMTVQYVCDDAGHVGLQIVPIALRDRIVRRRSGLGGLPYIDAVPGTGNPSASVIDPLVHVKIVGDPYPGAFAQAHVAEQSQRGSLSIRRSKNRSRCG